mmetsp:Transcript_91493/g.296109  ORF Transcript_91493/g.296109 Transcript_91493/m.296109 type:complete len:244 (+) Transcript_91493:796-1527(+)
MHIGIPEPVLRKVHLPRDQLAVATPQHVGSPLLQKLRQRLAGVGAPRAHILEFPAPDVGLEVSIPEHPKGVLECRSASTLAATITVDGAGAAAVGAAAAEVAAVATSPTTASVSAAVAARARVAATELRSTQTCGRPTLLSRGGLGRGVLLRGGLRRHALRVPHISEGTRGARRTRRAGPAVRRRVVVQAVGPRILVNHWLAHHRRHKQGLRICGFCCRSGCHRHRRSCRSCCWSGRRRSRCW